MKTNELHPDSSKETQPKRTYFLKSTQTSTDPAPPFVRRAMTWAKATNELIGVIRGVLADKSLCWSEVEYLRDWLGKRQELAYDLVIKGIDDRIRLALARRTDQELLDLELTLTRFTREDDAPTDLFFDSPIPEISIAGRRFCLTGSFLSGTREDCEERIQVLGGFVCAVLEKDTDFLVVGSKVSAAWANQTYGRKIEDALSAKKRGRQVKIVSEGSWLKAMELKASGLSESS